MQLTISFTYIVIVLFSAANIALTSYEDKFQTFVETVASAFHKRWRERFLSENPFTKNRFKLTKNGSHYNSSDFIYPMILTVGSCLVHRNLKVARARYNSSITYIDILNMDYDELPDDWKFENRATAQVACREVVRSVRQKRLFNQNLIETTSEKIHNAWIKRNAYRASSDLILPYKNLTESEKDKDRNAILIACRLFNELHFYRHFKTTPIHLILS